MDYTKVITTAIAFLFAVTEAFLIPWLKTKIDADRLKTLMEYIKIAVQAAEQTLGNKTGAAKKAYVIAYLEQKGIKFDEATIDAAIESAVLDLQGELASRGTK